LDFSMEPNTRAVVGAGCVVPLRCLEWGLTVRELGCWAELGAKAAADDAGGATDDIMAACVAL
jgi:hypothetical protein